MIHPSVTNSYILDATPGSTAFTTYMGHMFDIFDPDTWVFDLEDIAQALSTTCRFGGHVEFYSVAEHSIRVANWLKERGYDARTQMVGLLHDAVEAYIGDIVRPIKGTFKLDNESLLDLEKGMEYAMFSAFGLLDDDFDTMWKAAKQADLGIYYQERDERPKVGHGIPPEAIKREFLQHYEHLTARC